MQQGYRTFCTGILEIFQLFVVSYLNPHLIFKLGTYLYLSENVGKLISLIIY